MSTKQTAAMVVIVILVTLVVLSSAASDKPTDLEEYSSIEVSLGLFFITTPFWAPLVLALILMPKRTR